MDKVGLNNLPVSTPRYNLFSYLYIKCHLFHLFTNSNGSIWPCL